jgi:hypothetical protein
MRYRWVVTCYYTDDVEPPKRPGGLAIETVHATESSRDVEVLAAQSRPDIGVVDVADLTRDDPRQGTRSDWDRQARRST